MPPEFDPQSGTEAGDLFHNRLDEFINAHPGLTIDVRVKAATGPGGLLDSLSTTSAAAPAAIPSLVVLSRTEMETAALKGLVYPWAGMVKTSDTADVYHYAKNLGNVQGTNYGLAFSGDALVMVFRPLQVGYAPTSWNEYLARGYPVIFPADDPQAELMTQVLLSNAPEGQIPPEHPVVDQEELKKSYFVINEGVKNAVFPYWLADYDTFDKGYQAFLENRANYAVVWASTVINQLPENVSIAPLPAINAAPFTLANGWMWVLTNPSEEKRQLIVALAETLVDSKFLAEWTEAADLLPTSQSILKQWQNQAHVTILNDVASSARVIPSNEFTSSVGPILQQGVLGMVRGQINYLQALENSMKNFKVNFSCYGWIMETNLQQKPASKKNRIPSKFLGILVLITIAALFSSPDPPTIQSIRFPPPPPLFRRRLPHPPWLLGSRTQRTYSQTDGVILGAMSVMLILFVGTFVAILPSLKKK